jgi:uncharacterized protein
VDGPGLVEPHPAPAAIAATTSAEILRHIQNRRVEVLNLVSRYKEINTTSQNRRQAVEEASREAGLPPLHLAATLGPPWEVGYLLAKEAPPVNARDKDGATALHMAGLGLDLSGPGDALLNNGADINAADCNGSTPLHWASIYDNDYLVEKLIRRGVDIDMADHAGDTPLHVAAREQNGSVLELLVKGGGDVNRANRAGDTPLHVAAREQNVANVMLLAEWGGDPHRRNKDGSTPLEEASRQGLTAAARYLRNALTQKTA